MATSNKEDIIIMAVLAVTREDILTSAQELGLAPEQITEEVIALVKEKVSQSLRAWRQIVKGLVKEAIQCPLGMVCSPACAWREVGQCLAPKGLNRG